MKQLEIEFFWPLTEQIPLDLDFTESDKFSRNLYALDCRVTNGGTVAAWHSTCYNTLAPTTTSLHIQPSPNYAGHWEVSGENFRIFREKRPSWLIRKFNKLLIGWVWKDK